jgi:capsid protein
MNRPDPGEGAAFVDMTRRVIDHQQRELRRRQPHEAGFQAAHRTELIGEVVILQERQLGGNHRVAAIAELAIRFLQAPQAKDNDQGDDDEKR